MSKKTIPYNQKTCTNCLGTYYRALETEVYVFFVNFEESDENGQVKMYRKNKLQQQLELVSDNYFASVGIHGEFQEGNETWMSPRMKKERQLQIDEVILPLVKEYVELSRKGDIRERFNELENEIEEYHVSLPEMDVCAFLEEKFNL
jgi:hypothetical protein